MDRPRWVSKSNFERLQRMGIEEASEEITRLHEEYKAKRRAWRAAHKDAVYASQIKWKKNNRKKHLEARARERANINADPERRAHRTELRRTWVKKTGHKRGPATEEQTRRWREQRNQRAKTRSLAREKPDVLRAVIQKVLPGYLPPPAKLDVINSVMELALAHLVRHDQITRIVKETVSSYNRQYDYFKYVSIDAPIAGTDGLTRGDLLSSDMPHF